MNRRAFLLLFGWCGLWAWSVAEAAEWNAEKLAGLRTVLQSFVDQGEVAGAVALVGDRDGVRHVAAVGYRDLDAADTMKPDTLFRIASMTKPITAAAVMILKDEGKLSPDDPLELYFPAMRDVRFAGSDKPVRVRHLLTHTSGWAGGLPKELADLYQRRHLTLAEASERFVREPLTAEPGGRWAYCNSGIDLLGRIVEIRSGMSFEQFLEKRIFSPLGMTDTTFYPSAEQLQRTAITYERKDGKLVAVERDIIGSSRGAKYPIPAGGLYSTAPDLARFYRMMLARGEWEGKRILSAEAVEEMTSLQTGEITTGFVPGMGFGFGWGYVREPQGVTAMLSPGSYGHGGAFGTQGWIDPKRGVFIVFLIQRVGLPNGDNSEMRKSVQQWAIDALK